VKEQSEAIQALARAGRRVMYHLLQAAVEGLKAVEAVIEEVSSIGENEESKADTTRTRIEIE
jgi:hypothetical protein